MVVRKGSVQLLTSFLLVLRAAEALDEIQQDAMRRSCVMLRALAFDSMLSVRKAVIDAAAFLANEAPHDEEVASTWATVVLPMIQDAEATVQEAVQGEVRTSSLDHMFMRFRAGQQICNLDTSQMCPLCSR